MQEDITKIINFFKDSLIDDVEYIPLIDDEVDFKTFFDNKINERLYNDYFSFLGNYRGNYDFFDLLMQQNKNNQGLVYLRMILPEDYFYEVANHLFKEDKKSFLKNFEIINGKDLEYVISLGYTVQQVVKEGNMSGGFKEAYLMDPSLALDIINKHLYSAYEVAALEYLRGNKNSVNQYFKRISYNNNDLILFFREIVNNCDNFDLDDIITSLSLINKPDLWNNNIFL